MGRLIPLIALIASILSIATPSSGREIRAVGFDSNGRLDREKGCWWVDEDIPNGFGEWKFRSLPVKSFGKRVEIKLRLLMTDSRMSPGLEGDVIVTLSNPSTGARRVEGVRLRNVGGFTVEGSLSLPLSFLGRSGDLNVRIERPKDLPYRVGMRYDSVRVVEPEWAFEPESSVELMLCPTAYTPLRAARLGRERHYRMGVNGFLLYMPRAELEALKGQTISLFGIDLKWKLLEESRLRPALSIGFTGVYPFWRRPAYMRGEIFGCAYLVVSKTFMRRVTLTGGLMKGTVMDVFAYLPSGEGRIGAKARNMLFGGARLKVNGWLSLKCELIRSILDDKFYLSASTCISTLRDHLSFNIGISRSNLNEDRKGESYLLTRLKW